MYLCYKACKGKSSMFAYGRCKSYRCDCYCETSSTNGKCTQEYHSQFNLYAEGEYVTVAKQGEIVISIHFSLLTKDLGSRSLILIKFLSIGVSFALNWRVEIKGAHGRWKDTHVTHRYSLPDFDTDVMVSVRKACTVMTNSSSKLPI